MFLKKFFSFATLTLVIALTLSAIAAWYSVQGLVAIFAAAAIPIMIMGGSLEVAKVVTTVWLHRYWTRASWQIKSYLVPSVIVLAFLTSMGIFGFLSKAHIEQTAPVGDVTAQVQIIDEKINNERANIETAQRLLKQMDDAVAGIQAQPDQQIKNRDGSTSIRSSSERARVVRREQAKDRAVLTKEIQDAQANIVKFQEEKAPLNSQIREVEAEVGPIKYIAALIYGDNPDSVLLERAVRWVIIIIVLVFDPLALTLVLAAQSSYRWLEEDLQTKKENSNSSVKKEEDSTSENVNPLAMTVDPDWKNDPLENTPPVTRDGKPFLAEETKQWLDETNKEIDLLLGENQQADGLAPKEVSDTHEVAETITDLEVPGVVDDLGIPTWRSPDLDFEYNKELDEKLWPTEKTKIETVESDSVIQDMSPEELAEVKDFFETDRAGEPKEAPVAIETEGVTLQETDGGYVQFEGKSIHKNALQTMHPEMFAATADVGEQINTNFGTTFPKFSTKGDMFVRVDVLPNKVFKFDGKKWMEVNKAQTDSYLYDQAYLEYLIERIDKGEYDVDLLSENEKVEIENYLQAKKS